MCNNNFYFKDNSNFSLECLEDLDFPFCDMVFQSANV